VDRLAKAADDPAMMETADKAAAWRLWMKHNAGEKEVGVFGAVPKKKGAKPAEGEVPIIEGTHGGKDPRKEVVPQAPGRFDPKKRSAEYRAEAVAKREGAQMQLNHPPIEDLLIKEYGSGLSMQDLARRMQVAIGHPDKGPPIITGKMITAKLRELADKGRIELLGAGGAAAVAGSDKAEAKVGEGQEDVDAMDSQRHFEGLRSRIDTANGEAKRLEKAFLAEKNETKRKELFRDMLEAQNAANRLMSTGKESRGLPFDAVREMKDEVDRPGGYPLKRPLKGREPSYRKGDAQ